MTTHLTLNAKQAPGDWICECGPHVWTQNPGNLTHCRFCRKQSPMTTNQTSICKTCNDTHQIIVRRDGHEDRGRPCTSCPVPCETCRSRIPNCGPGAYCTNTPCNCSCHIGHHMYPPRRPITLCRCGKPSRFPSNGHGREPNWCCGDECYANRPDYYRCPGCQRGRIGTGKKSCITCLAYYNGTIEAPGRQFEIDEAERIRKEKTTSRVAELERHILECQNMSDAGVDPTKIVERLLTIYVGDTLRHHMG